MSAAPPRIEALARERDLGVLLAAFPSVGGDGARLYLFGRGMVVTGQGLEAAFAWRSTALTRDGAGRAFTFTDHRDRAAVTVLGEAARPDRDARSHGWRTAGPFARTALWVRAAEEGIANARR